MMGPDDRAWEPEPLELPLESPRRPRPVRGWDRPDTGGEVEGEPRERGAGSHVVVIDIA